MNRIFNVLAIGALVTVCAQVGHAKSIYVSTGGNDSTGKGTTSSPYKTIQRAHYDAAAGDVIYLKGGTYYPTKDEWIGSVNGTSSARITVQSAPNEWAILDGSSNGNGTSVLIINSSYITVQYLEIRNSKDSGIRINGDNNIVENCNVQGSYRSGIWTKGSYNKVSRCAVWNNCKANSARTADSGWSAGIDGYQCSYVSFSGNSVRENWGEGLLFQASSNCYIGYNTAYDNYSSNIYLDSTKNSLVE
jgi:parallel beta-helix repeat protein